MFSGDDSQLNKSGVEGLPSESVRGGLHGQGSSAVTRGGGKPHGFLTHNN